MRKILPLLLVLSMLLSALTISVSAEETLTDLQKVHSNLSTYLYEPYYESSEYFSEYKKVMGELEELLQSDDITQAEISKFYNDVRKIYAQLMQDTYDYSSLQDLIEIYDALDSSLFTEESWKKILSLRDSAKKELDSPSLFSRTEGITEKQYTAYVEKHIATFTSDFNAAFNRLVFVEAPEEMTAEYLAAFIKLLRFCSREEVLSVNEKWDDFLTALEDAEELVEKSRPDQKDLDESYETLTELYFEICNLSYDLTDVKDALSTYHILSSKSFSKESWDRYAAIAKDLEERMKKPLFFFMPLNADKETCEKYAEEYFAFLSAPLNNAKDTLVPNEDYHKLLNLCEKYKNKTTIEGLDIKLSLLKTRIAEGEAVLANNDSTLKDITTAIANIESAYNDLVVAEGHLLQEQEQIIKQDAKTSRYTITIYAASILLSIALAVLLSKIFYGKVNWSK